MRRFGLGVLSSLLAVGLIGCQKSDDSVHKKLDEVLTRLDKIEKSIQSAPPGAARPGAARPRGPQPGRPDPSAIYAVPIDGAPFKGPAAAKVTIVEAFEFA